MHRRWWSWWKCVGEVIEKLPLTPVIPALAVETLTAPKLVSVPTPEAMAMEPPKADVSTPPVTDKAPPGVEPIPDASDRLLPLPLEMIQQPWKQRLHRLPMMLLPI